MGIFLLLQDSTALPSLTLHPDLLYLSCHTTHGIPLTTEDTKNGNTFGAFVLMWLQWIDPSPYARLKISGPKPKLVYSNIVFLL